MLEEILNTRIMVKGAMKKAKHDKVGINIFTYATVEFLSKVDTIGAKISVRYIEMSAFIETLF